VESPFRAMSYISAKSFVDTNVLFYAHDPGSGAKHERAKQLVEDLFQSEIAVISTQVLQEFCVTVRRANRNIGTEQLRGWLRDFMQWQVVVNTGESILSAMEIEERYQISFWDALILQAAEISGATILYSEDLNDGQKYGSVRVVNPFRQQIS
jgi:predicted nucleic acid-binding protein